VVGTVAEAATSTPTRVRSEESFRRAETQLTRFDSTLRAAAPIAAGQGLIGGRSAAAISGSLSFVLSYDDVVSIMEFRDGLVAHETQYFADRFDPGPSRANLVERMHETKD
jgi:hypothetical protein